MNKAIFNKVWLSAIFCLTMISFLLPFPMTCYGKEPCPIDLEIEVSPYQVNIDSGGVEHYVRVLTYTQYSNTDEAFVYINEDEVGSDYIILTRDSYGHLVVKIDLVALQNTKLKADTSYELKIAVVLKKAIDECYEKEGIGEIYIIGKKSDMNR